MSHPLIVKKYGGATLENPKKIKAVARSLAKESKNIKLIIVVSAMGKTTNQLIDLAFQVSPQPLRRELDMLLSTGERISMALVSMALNDLKCEAISFTGSQAGIFTDNSHVNARIIDIKPIRVIEALEKNKIIILAGFQGVSPDTKEITTLGRGGSDTTAIAMAAFFNARQCEILKDVDGVYTADPKIIKSAKRIPKLHYDHLLEMTFWGAKVLHYRSVELAKTKNVNIYIGPAHGSKKFGTWVTGDHMFESTKILSVNSHENVFELNFTQGFQPELFKKILDENQIPYPQILLISGEKLNKVFITAPIENLRILQKSFPKLISDNSLSSVTTTSTGASSSEYLLSLLSHLKKNNISSRATVFSAMSITFIVPASMRKQAIIHLSKF